MIGPDLHRELSQQEHDRPGGLFVGLASGCGMELLLVAALAALIALARSC